MDSCSSKIWKTQDFTEIPKSVISKYSLVKIEEQQVDINCGDTVVTVYLKEATCPDTSPTRMDILFLHGKAFSSQNWEDLSTLSLAGAMGHRAVAIDLPGYGKSPGPAIGPSFLTKFIEQLKLGRPVIVSPSMSGGVSIPFILGNQPETANERVRGFVPIAPVGTSKFSTEQYASCPIPVMIVVGSNDEGIGKTSTKDLMNFSNCELFKIEDAGHACYMNKPDEWQKLLYNFILALEENT